MNTSETAAYEANIKEEPVLDRDGGYAADDPGIEPGDRIRGKTGRIWVCCGGYGCGDYHETGQFWVELKTGEARYWVQAQR